MFGIHIFGTWICIAIIAVAMVGLLTWWKSICAIADESEALEKCCAGFDDLSKLINKWLESKDSAKPENARDIGASWGGSYVSNRIFCIFCSVDPRHIVRRTPPLSDLREITVQAEQSGWCVSFLRFITPCVLVLGILGTLYGVHEQMYEAQQAMEQGLDGISCISKALIPGLIAVFFTIGLIVIRGIYGHRWSDYIKRLDEFTIQKLLPQFSQKSDLENYSVTLTKEMKNLTVPFQNFKKVLDAFKDFSLVRTSENISAALEKMSASLLKLKTLCANLQDIMHLQTDINRGVISLSAELLDASCLLTRQILSTAQPIAAIQSELNRSFMQRQRTLGNVYGDFTVLKKIQYSFARQCNSYIRRANEVGTHYNKLDRPGMDGLATCTSIMIRNIDILEEKVGKLKNNMAQLQVVAHYTDASSSWFLKQGKTIIVLHQEINSILSGGKQDIDKLSSEVTNFVNNQAIKMRGIMTDGLSQTGFSGGWAGIKQRLRFALRWLFMERTGQTILLAAYEIAILYYIINRFHTF